MLSYPAAVASSSRTLNHLADLIRTERTHRLGRWRRLDAGRKALLALAHLRNPPILLASPEASIFQERPAHDRSG